MLSDYTNGGKQAKINSANYSRTSVDKSAVQTGDVPSASNPSFKPRGAPTTFNSKNQYIIENFSYPSDLMSASYGENKVVFYINVSNDSKLLKDSSNVIVDDNTSRDRGDLIGTNLSQGQVTFASAGEGIIAGGIGGKILSGDVKGAVKVGLAVGGLSTLGVTAIGFQTSSFSRQQKRLQTAIAMHIPNTLSIRYGMNWGEEETKNFAMAAAGGDAIMKAVQNGNIDQLTGPALAIAAAIALDTVPGKDAVSAASGLASNPRKEQIFKSVDFRTFQFDYQFFPRDAQEAQNVLNIIYQFKLHMHPEFKDSSNFLYIYPSEFDIYYYQGTTENMNIHRHTSCVLTEMTVQYSPQGQFTTFDNGMPTQINMTLNFKELALLTKEKIQDGY